MLVDSIPTYLQIEGHCRHHALSSSLMIQTRTFVVKLADVGWQIEVQIV